MHPPPAPAHSHLQTSEQLPRAPAMAQTSLDPRPAMQQPGALAGYNPRDTPAGHAQQAYPINPTSALPEHTSDRIDALPHEDAQSQGRMRPLAAPADAHLQSVQQLPRVPAAAQTSLDPLPSMQQPGVLPAGYAHRDPFAPAPERMMQRPHAHAQVASPESRLARQGNPGPSPDSRLASSMQGALLGSPGQMSAGSAPRRQGTAAGQRQGPFRTLGLMPSLDVVTPPAALQAEWHQQPMGPGPQAMQHFHEPQAPLQAPRSMAVHGQTGFGRPAPPPMHHRLPAASLAPGPPLPRQPGAGGGAWQQGAAAIPSRAAEAASVPPRPAQQQIADPGPSHAQQPSGPSAATGPRTPLASSVQQLLAHPGFPRATPETQLLKQAMDPTDEELRTQSGWMGQHPARSIYDGVSDDDDGTVDLRQVGSWPPSPNVFAFV